MTEAGGRAMRYSGTQAELWTALSSPAIDRAVVATEHVDGRMHPYQCAALYRLAADYDGGRILEIGCFHGRSALIMSLAAPLATIVTMSPDIEQVRSARRNVEGCRIGVIKTKSWDYLGLSHDVWDMIFVDGDHRRVMRDVPWFNRLRTGGLMLFHDYTPEEATERSHVEVCGAVGALGQCLGRAPDVLIVDDHLVGMAGFYRRGGKVW